MNIRRISCRGSNSGRGWGERERGEGRGGGDFYILVKNFCKVFYCSLVISSVNKIDCNQIVNATNYYMVL